MKIRNQIHRAAMGALVAAALMAGAQQASAGAYRAPADKSYRVPMDRAKKADDHSGDSWTMLTYMWRFPQWGPRPLRFPADRAKRSN